MSQIQEIVARIQKSAARLAESAEGSESASLATRELKCASYELHIATTPPQDLVYGDAYRHVDLATYHAINKLGFLHAIPDTGAISYADLAEKVAVNQDVVERLCRFAATFGAFQEASYGFVEHTAASRLARDNSIAMYFGPEVMAPTALRFPEALSFDSRAEEPSSAASAFAHSKPGGPRQDIWTIMAETPRIRDCFTRLMQFGSLSSNSGGQYVKDAFDWASLPSGSRVVDVGGGKGHIMLGLAKVYPKLELIVQDRTALMNGELSGSGVKFVEGDFFTPQKIEADVYYFRKIFHDWSDKYAQKILENLKPALKTGTKLIIDDFVLPQPKGHPDHTEYIARRNDVLMLMMLNGKERSLEQWKTMVMGYDARWRFESLFVHEGTVSGLLVFEYV